MTGKRRPIVPKHGPIGGAAGGANQAGVQKAKGKQQQQQQNGKPGGSQQQNKQQQNKQQQQVRLGNTFQAQKQKPQQQQQYAKPQGKALTPGSSAGGQQPVGKKYFPADASHKPQPPLKKQRLGEGGGEQQQPHKPQQQANGNQAAQQPKPVQQQHGHDKKAPKPGAEQPAAAAKKPQPAAAAAAAAAPPPAAAAQQQQQQQPEGLDTKKPKKHGKKRKAGDAAAAPPAIDPAKVAAVARAPPGSNWQALKQQLVEQAATAPKWKRRPRAGAAAGAGGAGEGPAGKKPIGAIGTSAALTQVVAVDCEFVGVGPGGESDALARVSVVSVGGGTLCWLVGFARLPLGWCQLAPGASSLPSKRLTSPSPPQVNNEGNVLLDTFVAVKERVADYRTWVSGVRPQDLIGAPSLEDVQERVAKMVEGRTLVGHSLSKDLKVLLLSHPRKDIRDTAK
jgi:hypothetical protein